MQLSREQISTELTNYLLTQLLSATGISEIDANEDLLEDGLIDSLGVMQLLAFIQEQFGYEVPPEEVTVENFVSISAMSAFLHSSMQGRE